MTDDLAADLCAWFSAMSSQADKSVSVELARALIAVTATDFELGAALNKRLADPIVARIVTRIALAKKAGEVREDVDAPAIANQLIAMSSNAALLGRPLDARQVDAAVDVTLRGIGAEWPSRVVCGTFRKPGVALS